MGRPNLKRMSPPQTELPRPRNRSASYTEPPPQSPSTIDRSTQADVSCKVDRSCKIDRTVTCTVYKPTTCFDTKCIDRSTKLESRSPSRSPSINRSTASDNPPRSIRRSKTIDSLPSISLLPTSDENPPPAIPRSAIVSHLQPTKKSTPFSNVPCYTTPFDLLHIAIKIMLLSSANPTHVSEACDKFSLTQLQFETLHARSKSAKSTAYCPYSQFRVGATILTNDGQFIDGANVENAAYPVGTCAERVAFGKAITEGHKKFKAVAVATDISPPASPCGMCRQLLVFLRLAS
jgi:homotetrameric cytidine deaminase